MDTFARFVFHKWWVFALLGSVMFILFIILSNSIEEMGYQSSKKQQVLSFKKARIGVSVLLLFSCILPAIATARSSSQWNKVEASVPAPRGTFTISPSEGTFLQDDLINLEIKFENLGKAPVTKMTVVFSAPLAENIVVNHLNATINLSYTDEKQTGEGLITTWVVKKFGLDEIVKVGKKQYSAPVEIPPEQTLLLLIPIQFTEYGNIDGNVELILETTMEINIEPIGFRTDTIVTKSSTFTSAISWVVLKK